MTPIPYHTTMTTTFFFFNDTATTEIYTLSLHDALPIFHAPPPCRRARPGGAGPGTSWPAPTSCRTTASITRSAAPRRCRSEEHTSELQSLRHLVCRLLLEKKKINKL